MGHFHFPTFSSSGSPTTGTPMSEPTPPETGNDVMALDEGATEEPVRHSMDPPQYYELVLCLIKLRREYPELKGHDFERASSILRGWHYCHHTTYEWAARQWERADDAARMRLGVAKGLPSYSRDRIRR